MTPDVGTAGGFFERSPAQEYFQALEAVMIKHRGTPFQLSPDDWQISKSWLGQGIPLDLVDETIGEVVEKRRAKEKEIPRRLTFYRQAVEAAWQRVGALSAPGARREAPSFDLGARLGNLAAAVRSAATSHPALIDFPSQILGATGDDLEAVEATLAELDSACLAAAEAGLAEDERLRLRAEVGKAVETRLDLSPEPPSEEMTRRIRVAAVRRWVSLPVLSLFSPEAAGEGSEPRDAP
ncbi:MAG: hypothetical protein AAGF23_09310 [Acidobacteriota bacterium]